MSTTRTKIESLWKEGRGVVWTLWVCLSVLWAVELVDVSVYGGKLDLWGIMPREAYGLRGVLAAPLLHADYGHLASNTIGIIIFGGLVAMIGRREFFAVTVAGWLVGGMGVWLVGRHAVHIGASGVVFAFFGYLLLRGWYERKFWSVLLSSVLFWAYGSLLWGMLPGFAEPNVSWEGHLFGFLGGVLVARVLHQRIGRDAQQQVAREGGGK